MYAKLSPLLITQSHLLPFFISLIFGAMQDVLATSPSAVSVHWMTLSHRVEQTPLRIRREYLMTRGMLHPHDMIVFMLVRPDSTIPHPPHYPGADTLRELTQCVSVWLGICVPAPRPPTVSIPLSATTSSRRNPNGFELTAIFLHLWCVAT